MCSRFDLDVLIACFSDVNDLVHLQEVCNLSVVFFFFPMRSIRWADRCTLAVRSPCVRLGMDRVLVEMHRKLILCILRCCAAAHRLAESSRGRCALIPPCHYRVRRNAFRIIGCFVSAFSASCVHLKTFIGCRGARRSRAFEHGQRCRYSLWARVGIKLGTLVT